ncbi:MAG: hypothetical protein QMD77_03815 [Patescibacteria group bacterium]|nr:hypothetical protein [Patescibacteria group bacterium]
MFSKNFQNPTWKLSFQVIVLLAGLVLAFSAASAEAKPNPPAIEVITDDPIFNVQNAAPGEKFEKPVTILNHGPDTEKFRFEIQNEKMSVELARHLYFQIKDDGGVCLFGCDAAYSVESLNKDEILIEKIKPHSTNIYNFILVFDENVGNEFQNLTTVFDIKLGYQGKRPVGNGNGGGGAVGAVAPGPVAGLLAAVTGGVVGGEAVSVETAPEEQVEGAKTGPEEGKIMGEEVSLCQGWPKWVWVLMLISYFAAFLWRTFDKIKEQIEKREIRWRWQAVLALAAFLVWYFFDKCREFQWFVILALVGGAAVYICYLYFYKRRIKVQPEKKIQE